MDDQKISNSLEVLLEQLFTTIQVVKDLNEKVAFLDEKVSTMQIQLLKIENTLYK